MSRGISLKIVWYRLTKSVWSFPGYVRERGGAAFILLGLSGFLGVPLSGIALAGDAQAEEEISLIESVNTTLSKDPVIQIEKRQVEISKGSLEARSSVFDLEFDGVGSNGTSRDPLTEAQQSALGDGRDKLQTDSAVLSAGLSKLFRSGWLLAPTLTTSRTETDTSGTVAANSTSFDISASYPLLRGRGREVVTSGETSSKLNLESARMTLKHLVSIRVLNTATAYFDYVSAHKSLSILRESENRAQLLVNETKRLIEADEVPANESLQLLANLADKTASRISQQQALFDAKQALGLAMGLDLSAITDLGMPSDTFPDFSKWEAPARDEEAFFIEEAFRRRFDLKSAETLLRIAQIQQTVSRNGLKSKLDFSLQAGYNSLDEGSSYDQFFGSIANDPGFNATATLQYQWTFKNQSAKGTFRSASATLEQNILQTDDLKRNIASSVLSAIEALRSKGEELKASSEAIQLYQSAINNEKKKFRLGFSTLLDVISLEDRLTSTLLSYLNRQALYTVAILNFRFQIGLLDKWETNTDSMTYNDLLGVPQATQ